MLPGLMNGRMQVRVKLHGPPPTAPELGWLENELGCQRGSLGVRLHSCSCACEGRWGGVCEGANREGGGLALILSK